jgi:GntR family transcriptional regulator
LKIDPNSHVPIYLQIVDGIRAAIAAGVYRPDELLPSLRALAVDLVVNPNTVQKAYDELEREGLIYSRRGLGMFVAKRGTRSAQSQAEDTVYEAFRQGIEAGRAANMAAARIQSIFDRALDQVRSQMRERS